MGTKRRGRERLEICVSCGRSIPRDKAVSYTQRNVFTTDLKGADNVSLFTDRDVYYCISCAKHRKIFEKKQKLLAERRKKLFLE
jgi:ribosomal protein S26